MSGQRKTEALDKRLAWVVPQGGSQEGQVYPVRSGDVIGAGPGANIEIKGGGVQSKHIQLVDDGSTWTIVHLVEEGRRATLIDGKSITMGTVSLVFRSL